MAKAVVFFLTSTFKKSPQDEGIFCSFKTKCIYINDKLHFKLIAYSIKWWYFKANIISASFEAWSISPHSVGGTGNVFR